MSALEGITISHYQLQRLLAYGGMSEVYLAFDMHTQRQVAMKLVRSDHKEYCERFQREIKAVSALQHDHILPAFDYGTHGLWCYLVMPYICGGTLRERLADAPLTLKEAGAILGQLTDALQYAHERSIIHRDIKPSNVLLRDGEHVYLADFGLVKDLDDDSSVTRTGFLMGTPEYMAPELVERKAAPASDVYSLGVVLYQMLTGTLPFKSTTPMGIYWKHLREQPLLPSALNPAIPYGVEQVILRALAKEPRRRFSSARAMMDAYRAAIEVRPVTTLPMFALSEQAHPRLNVRRASAGLGVLLCLFVLPTWLGFTFYYNSHRSHIPALTTSLPLWADHPIVPVVPKKTSVPPPTVPTGGSGTDDSVPSSTPRTKPHGTPRVISHKRPSVPQKHDAKPKNGGNGTGGDDDHIVENNGQSHNEGVGDNNKRNQGEGVVDNNKHSHNQNGKSSNGQNNKRVVNPFRQNDAVDNRRRSYSTGGTGNNNRQSHTMAIVYQHSDHAGKHSGQGKGHKP